LETKNIAFAALVLAIENTPVFARWSAQFANGAQMEHAAVVPPVAGAKPRLPETRGRTYSNG